MTKHLSLFICLATLLASLALAADAPAPLFPNGDFATATKSTDWPDGWSHPEGSTWEKDGDAHYIRLASTQPSKMVLAYRAVTLPSPLPPAIEIRVRVRYNDVKVGEKKWYDARIMSHFQDAAGKTLKGEPPPIAFKGTSAEWVDRSVFAKVPANAKTLDLMPALFQVASGTLDIAKCEVYPASLDQLPKPPPIIASTTLAPSTGTTLPPELHVDGNQLKTADGKTVWLQGLCLDSMQWANGGEKIQQSVPVAIDQWHANVIRLPVIHQFWFGRPAHNQKPNDGGLKYRAVVDAAVNEAASRGAYVALDLHEFGAPTDEDVEFWKDAALRYKNNPAVLFELFNEPHSISWKVWRDGGDLKSKENKSTDVNVTENKDAQEGEQTPGMQAMLDAVRSVGAHNIVIVGGLDWGYNLSGVVNGFALADHDGNGIMYSSHIYPWKKDWQKNTLDAAAKYPIFVGEVGNPSKWDDFKFIPEKERYEPVGVESAFPGDVIGMIQKYKLNWTGFSFHPHCGPQVILDWNYTPTPYWGVFVKDALAGKVFEMKKLR